MEAGDVIKIEGPPSDSEKAKEILESEANGLITKMDFVEIDVDAKYHKHIIGKGGATGGFQMILFNWKIHSVQIDLIIIQLSKYNSQKFIITCVCLYYALSIALRLF